MEGRGSGGAWAPTSHAGGMFWFSRNRFVGSYRRLISRSRSQVAPRVRGADALPGAFVLEEIRHPCVLPDLIGEVLDHPRTAGGLRRFSKSAATFTMILLDRCAKAVASVGALAIAPPSTLN